MRMRIVGLVFLMVILILSCNNSKNSSNSDIAKSPAKVMISELYGINQTIRNFQDLLKRKPDKAAYDGYAEYLERRMAAMREDFPDELEANTSAENLLKAIEKSLPDLKNSDENKRNLAQKYLNDANENAATELKLN